MSGGLETFEVVAQIAVRNLLASKWKTLIVGGIIGFGAFLVVLGTSMLDSVDHSMSRSIIGSVAGNIQVYSTKSKEELDVMGGFSMEGSQLDPLSNFAEVRKVVMSVPNVSAVVPMGINGSLVMSGNTVDQALSRLRETVTKKQQGDTSAAVAETYVAEKDHVRQIVTVLKGELENVTKLLDSKTIAGEETSVVTRAAAPEFWTQFDQDPLDHLEFLENRIAPLATDADMLFLRYVGTDPKVFAQSFDRMSIVDGKPIPEGERGFLFSKYTYEDQVKLKTARRLDRIKEERENRKVKITEDAELTRMARELSTQTKELVLQLDAPKTKLFQGKLQAFLKSPETDVGKLLEKLLTVTDQNFDERYAFFYKELAPSLELYRVRIGDMLTIKAFTRSGYVQSANLKVYGTFAFKGLEKSPQAGSLNLMDLVSFRELYGYLTADREQEIAALRAKAGAKEVTRENAEAELFGSVAETGTTGTTAEAGLAETELATLAGGSKRRLTATSNYDPRQLEEGVFLNAAVLVKDDKKLPQTIKDIEEAGKKAGLPLKAVSWQQASGIIGQFAVLMRVVLYTAVLIIFVVALVIINNALVMATLERVRELGTLRAIGAQRRFILAMLVLESVVVGLLFGTIGALLGAAVVAALGHSGVPAANEVMMFFFSGPKLFPALSGTNLVGSLVIVLVVSVISSIYPAWIAMRVSPREAMQAEE